MMTEVIATTRYTMAIVTMVQDGYIGSLTPAVIQNGDFGFPRLLSDLKTILVKTQIGNFGWRTPSRCG
jgi:hypothetical protein